MHQVLYERFEIAAIFNKNTRYVIKLSCWTRIWPAFSNRSIGFFSVDPDPMASEEANWSGSALFVVQYVNLYQQPRSSNLNVWKLEVGVAS